MMLISTLGRTERAVGGAGWGIMLLMSMLGGGMIPLIAMPGWLQTASHASPVKWAILAMEGAIWRGFSLAEMLLPCAILVGVGGAAFAAGVANFARIER
jgi:ABC-2 type transport system permease protein